MLSVSIEGKPCFEAMLVISIASENGAVWYRYEAPFKNHVVTHWEDPLINEDARRLAKQLTQPDLFRRTSALPEWLQGDEYPEMGYQEFQVDRARYEDLREANWITYDHPIHYEAVISIAFDQKKQEVVEVLEGGV